MDKNTILHPYRTWQLSDALREIVDESDTKVGHPDYRPNIITINGPKGSGKSYTGARIRSMGFDIEHLTLTGRLYWAMQFDKLPDTHLSYEEFKALPYGRERLIEASEYMKQKEGDLIWCYLLPALPGFRTGMTVFIDNIGFDYEADFLRDCASEYAGIHFFEDAAGNYMPVTDDGRWVNDSRKPVITDETLNVKNSIAFEFWLESQMQLWNTHRADVQERAKHLMGIMMGAYGGVQEQMTFE